MSTILRDERGSLTERVVLLGCVAIAGMAGLGRLGNAMGHAIAGAADGEPPLPAVSTQAAALEDFARAAKGLYQDVPLTAANTGRRDQQVMGPLIQAMDVDKIDLATFTERFGSTEDAPLIYDLHREFLRLRDQGVFETGNYQYNQQSNPSELVQLAIVRAHHSQLTIANVKESLDKARVMMEQRGEPIPEAFFERIQTTKSIYVNGIDDATRDRVFTSAGRGKYRTPRRTKSVTVEADVDELASFLGRFEGPGSVPAVFASKYFEDPAGTLALIPEAGRRYLESEVLPILRAEGDERGVRLIRGEDEADVVTAIVMGDTSGLEGALAKAQENASGALPDEFDDVAQYAARTFTPFWDSLGKLRRFREEEAESLVRFPNADLDALRARTEGGDVIASTLESLNDVDLVPLPGRPAAHQNKVLEGLIRSVARGLPDEYDRFLGYAAEMFEELPESMTSHFEQLLERFKGGAS